MNDDADRLQDVPEEAWDERILRLVPSGVDATQVEENLRLTPTERLQRLQEALASLQAAGALLA